MYQFLIIAFSVYVCFGIESLLNALGGGCFTPNLLIILIVFFNLYRGIRYSLLTALVAGLLKDSFGVAAFGLNTTTFIASAYLASLLKLYTYQAGVSGSRVLLVFCICSVNITLQYLVNMMFSTIEFSRAFTHIFVPEIMVTTALTPYVFRKFKQCALRLFA